MDVGTGFYVEKTTKDARKFYEGKVEELEGNLGRIEEVVRQKTETLRAVEDGMRKKVVEGEGRGGAQAAQASG